jgi:hypothetical protein
MGDNIEAIPTPTPAIKRAAINEKSVGANAIANEDKAKMHPEIIRAALRPRFSESLPASKHPRMHPSASEPVVNPSQYAFRPNSVFKKGSAPEITAKSNPKRYPPRAEIRQINSIYRIL